MEFNQEQLEAINAENKNILVSAGAGAGKSGTLTERVIHLIRNGKADILQMLVITFTRDAAASIRDKIRRALQESVSAENSGNDFIKESAASMHASHISTIHSFCSEVIRQGASLIDLDTNFTIIEDSIRKKTFEKAVNDAIDEFGKKTYPKDRKSYFGAFKRAINIENITSICYPIYDVLMGIPKPFEKLNEVIDNLSLSPNPWEQAIVDYVQKLMLSKEYLIEELEALHKSPFLKDNYKTVCVNDIALIKTFLTRVKAAADANALIAAAQDLASNCGSTRKASNLTDAEQVTYEHFLSIHGLLKNKPKTKSDKNPVQYAVGLLNEISKCNQTDILRTQKQIRGLAVLLEEVHNHFTAIKRNNATLDYSDLEQYAYEILNDHPDMRAYIQNKYKYIFVDECQDVSAIQHAIINLMRSETTNLFYVGDIKQSIYRFRHADPMQFLKMRTTYSESRDAEFRKIYFQKNYRSTETIIEGVNMVFSNLLDKSYTEIDYEPGDHLQVGKTENYDKGTPNEIILVNDNIPLDPATGDPITDTLQAQCAELGARINELLREGYSFKDIVVLIRKKGNGPKILDYLTAMRIPGYFNGKSSFYDTPEISLLVDILKTINNDYQDYPLLATLRSNIFRFTDLDFAEIRLAYDRNTHTFSEAFHEAANKNTTALEKRCFKALEVINRFKKEASEVCRASEVIWNVIRKTNYFACQAAYPDGEIRQKNLNAFYDKALAYEALGNYKLSDFLEHVDDLRKTKGGGSDDPVPMTDNDDFVRIMTIHGSKGLEFPVVFLLEAQRNIHYTDKSPVQVHIETSSTGHPPLGIYMDCGSTVGKVRTAHETYGKTAFKAMNTMHDIAEEARVLYVAMTRAMKKLIIVGSVKTEKTNNWYVKSKAYRLMNANSMLDMIMPAVLDGAELDHEGVIVSNRLWKVSLMEAKKVDAAFAATNAVHLPTMKNDIDFGKEWDAIRKSRTSIPSKTAVSYIQNHQIEAGNDKVGYIALSEDPETPEFIGGKQSTPEGAMLGTLLHSVMRTMPLEPLKGMDKAQIQDYVERYVRFADGLSDMQAEEIVKQMSTGMTEFLASPIGQEICMNGSVKREQAFVCWINIGNYKLLLQGIIDMMYKTETGEFVIVDYKTDHDTRDESIRQKHSEQINYYRMAVEKTTGINVSKMYAITMRNGKAVEIQRNNVKYM